MALHPAVRALRDNAARCVVAVCLVMCVYEYRAQMEARRFVRRVALEVVAAANATDSRSKVLALRDYLRAHVSFKGVPQEGRPLLRDTAAETLRSGRGWCGEVSRAFICMAKEVGVEAQRVNLTGQQLHTVAEAEISLGERVIVDSQNPPAIADLEPLESVILRPEYADYYTVNLERLRLRWLIGRISLRTGFLTYWLENPPLIKATLWLVLAVALASLGLLQRAGRRLLLLRGWTPPPARSGT